MSSTEPNWERVKEWVADALDLPPAERPAYLARLDAEPPELMDRVRRLVAASEDGEVLPESALELLGPAGAAGLPGYGGPGERAGSRVGSYQVQRFVARGGMGEVWEAVQDGTGRRVALKLLPPSPSADRARFVLEGRLLGRLEHPAIAQILEADVHRAPDGTEWPYFALEYVDGDNLTTHADARGLSRAERLRLLIEVCHGVQHAHQKGVIHRDLKPDNILVADAESSSGLGQPKILDFGVARVLERDALHAPRTRAGELVGTLAHMSPEQLAGEPDAVDTRADVYALGVLLYQLLTGALPFELVGLPLSDAVAKLQSTEPAPPSHHDRTLRGDLDTICAAALAKERAHRYASASELAADLTRHLNHEPIAARPASRVYQLKKFARRNRGLVAGLAVAFCLLALGAAGTTWGFVRASEKAEHAENVSRFLRNALGSANPRTLGRDVRVREMLDVYAPRIAAEFEEQPRVRAELHATVGRTYLGLGEVRSADHHLASAVELYRELEPADSILLFDTELWHESALIELEASRPEARERLASLEERVRRAHGADHPARIRALALQGADHTLRLEVDAAHARYREAYAAAQRAFGPDDLRTLEYAQALAELLNNRSEYEQAYALAAEARAGRLAVLGPRHPDTLTSIHAMASALLGLGRAQEALETYEEVHALGREVWGESHPELVGARAGRATALARLGRLEEAAEALAEVYRYRLELNGPAHPQTLTALHDLAASLAYLGRTTEAESRARELLARVAEAGADSEHFAMRGSALLAGLLADQGRLEEALELSGAALEEHRAVLGERHPMTLYQANNHALLLDQLGRLDESLELYAATIASWTEALPGRRGELRTMRWSYGRALVDAGRIAEAEAQYRLVDELTGPDAEGHPTRLEWLRTMVVLYRAWNRADAGRVYEQALAREFGEGGEG